LRVIRVFFWTERAEYTPDGLLVDMEKLKAEILKHIINRKPGRQYPRKTKTGGAYKKFK
jgi:hypothetical protein